MTAPQGRLALRKGDEMVVAIATPEPFRGEMVRETVLAHVDRLTRDGIEKDEAIGQVIDAIIQSRRADDFVRAFGGTSIKGMLTNREAPKHPIRYTPQDERTVTGGGRQVGDTHRDDAASTERDDGEGQTIRDAHVAAALPPPPEPIVQGFPEPGAGRVVDIALLSKPRKLTGVLAGKWSVEGDDVPLGLLTPAQCFKLSASETRRGRAHVTNGTMFRRLGQSLDPDQVVADRWDNDGIMTQFELAEPKL